jgi:uncharacterized coiled-coil protein SlyX
MESFVFLFQILLLAFTVYAWHTAKKDLTATAAKGRAADESTMKELRETIEQLITVLEQKAGQSERRLQTLIDRAAKLAPDNAAQPQPTTPPVEGKSTPKKAKPIAPEPKSASMPGTQLNTMAFPSAEGDFHNKLAASIAASAEAIKAALPENEALESATSQPAVALESNQSDPYSKVYTLYDSGVQDLSELARQTGLGYAEVSMVLSLRPRNKPS